MAKKTLTITAPQVRTLKVISQFISERQIPPTMSELSELLGISHSSAHEQVQQLTRKGYLKREPRKSRSMVVIKRIDEAQLPLE